MTRAAMAGRKIVVRHGSTVTHLGSVEEAAQFVRLLEAEGRVPGSELDTLNNFEAVLRGAGSHLALGRKATTEEVRRTLVSVGELDLAKRWVTFRAGRRLTAHPDPELADEVLLALEKGGVTSYEAQLEDNLKEIEEEKGLMYVEEMAQGMTRSAKGTLQQPPVKYKGEPKKKDLKCSPDDKATCGMVMVSARCDGDVTIQENSRLYKGESANNAEKIEVATDREQDILSLKADCDAKEQTQAVQVGQLQETVQSLTFQRDTLRDRLHEVATELEALKNLVSKKEQDMSMDGSTGDDLKEKERADFESNFVSLSGEKELKEVNTGGTSGKEYAMAECARKNAVLYQASLSVESAKAALARAEAECDDAAAEMTDAYLALGESEQREVIVKLGLPDSFSTFPVKTAEF
ncbi:unnamed protein product [Prorocentrum cordatum]|uniref:Uncharacterized protein n=1 Tax=Prorocentrum cordatum TaxID=2364126 RepID=A0ABN9R5E6_9DINO|nr:unnamed protein product [Polarella glacialis]CAK0833408.1 unnamed protein product [Polarella glacialis]